jgi:hypothetical protein
MPRRHDGLFGRIANFQALHDAARRAIKGKRKKPGAASFFANLEGELLALERQLRDSEYRPGHYVAFEVNDPKRRIVSAAPFRDRVVHHALCAVVEPIFEAGFILRGLRDRWRAGTIELGDADARVGAWIAHAEHADTWRLRHAIFRGGWFDPANTLEAWTAPCRRVVRGGSWNNNPQNLRSANRNRNTTRDQLRHRAAGLVVLCPSQPPHHRAQPTHAKISSPFWLRVTPPKQRRRQAV